MVCACSMPCTKEPEPEIRVGTDRLAEVQAHAEDVTEDERAFLRMAAGVADRIMSAAKGVRDAAANVLIKLGFEIHNLLCVAKPALLLHASLAAQSRHAGAEPASRGCGD